MILAGLSITDYAWSIACDMGPLIICSCLVVERTFNTAGDGVTDWAVTGPAEIWWQVLPLANPAGCSAKLCCSTSWY